jgi:hypothetical protein
MLKPGGKNGQSSSHLTTSKGDASSAVIMTASMPVFTPSASATTQCALTRAEERQVLSTRKAGRNYTPHAGIGHQKKPDKPLPLLSPPAAIPVFVDPEFTQPTSAAQSDHPEMPATAQNVPQPGALTAPDSTAALVHTPDELPVLSAVALLPAPMVKTRATKGSAPPPAQLRPCKPVPSTTTAVMSATINKYPTPAKASAAAASRGYTLRANNGALIGVVHVSKKMFSELASDQLHEPAPAVAAAPAPTVAEILQLVHGHLDEEHYDEAHLQVAYHEKELKAYLQKGVCLCCTLCVPPHVPNSMLCCRTTKFWLSCSIASWRPGSTSPRQRCCCGASTQTSP